jgi:hypothetical protein
MLSTQKGVSASAWDVSPNDVMPRDLELVLRLAYGESLEQPGHSSMQLEPHRAGYRVIRVRADQLVAKLELPGDLPQQTGLQ